MKNVTLIGITNKHESRIGSIGTLITRVSYLISMDGQLALSYFYSPPPDQIIENEFRQLGSDMRVYPEKNSISKSLLSSLYVQMYPLSPSYRVSLETRIANAIQSLSLLPGLSSNTNQVKSVNILYYELYMGQLTGNDVSRVYYSFYVNNQLVYPCELVDLYLSNATSVPNLKAFDYMIKTRFIDFEYENIVINETKLENTIQTLWFNKSFSRGVNQTQIKVQIDQSSFYTSVFKK